MIVGKGFERFDSVKKTIEELCYMGAGKLAKSTGKQRAYIRGLLEKVMMDEDDLQIELGTDIPISDLTIGEAAEAIETLLEIKKSKGIW